MRRLVESAVDQGVTFYDTADVYMQGASEKLLGAVFRKRRDRVVIATKVGLRPGLPAGLVTRLRPGLTLLVRLFPRLARLRRRAREVVTGEDFSPGYVQQAIDASLRRLGTDWIDLLQLHSPPVSVARMPELFELLDRLTAAGKVRSVGVAFGSLAACWMPPAQATVTVVQMPVAPRLETKGVQFREVARARGLGVIGNQPFRKGEIFRRRHASRSEDRPGDPQVLAQTVIRFVTRLDGVSTVLAGTTSEAHLKANIDALALPPPGQEEMESLGLTTPG
jgi:aryl-alcohol dehydrogenase-like predicted oxidoreductase